MVAGTLPGAEVARAVDLRNTCGSCHEGVRGTRRRTMTYIVPPPPDQAPARCRVFAVESDPVWVARLRERFAGSAFVDVIEADAPPAASARTVSRGRKHSVRPMRLGARRGWPGYKMVRGRSLFDEPLLARIHRVCLALAEET